MAHLSNNQLIDVYQVVENITANLPQEVFTIHTSVANPYGNPLAIITVGSADPEALTSLPGTHEHVASRESELKQQWWHVYAGQCHGMSIYLRYATQGGPQ